MARIATEVGDMFSDYANSPAGVKIRMRRASNIKILWLLFKFALKHKELRFGQILNCLQLDSSQFFEESADTLEHIRERLKPIDNSRNGGLR